MAKKKDLELKAAECEVKETEQEAWKKAGKAIKKALPKSRKKGKDCEDDFRDDEEGIEELFEEPKCCSEMSLEEMVSETESLLSQLDSETERAKAKAAETAQNAAKLRYTLKVLKDRLAEVEAEEAEAKAKAEAEARAKAEAEAKAKAKAKAEAEAKAKAEAEEAKEAARQTGKDLVPGKGYKYWSSKDRCWKLTGDLWKASQIAGNVWKAVYVLYNGDGSIIREMTEEEILKYLP